MNKLLPVLFVLCLFLASCDNDDDKAKAVDPKGSIAVTLSTNHIDSLRDVVTSHYVVWRNGIIAREFDVKDTIPGLGTKITEGENDNGDTKTMVVPKDYDFFVTVK